MTGHLKKTRSNATGLGLSLFPPLPFFFSSPASWLNMESPQVGSQ